MSIKLRRLQIPDDIAEQLAKKDVRFCKDVLSRSSTELLRVCDCSYSQIKFLQKVCSEAVSPKMSNALLMKEGQQNNNLIDGNCQYMPTSLPGLDEILRGGLPCGTITEITGPSGCGKTQLCLMLSTLASVSSQRGVIYIDTEGAFSAQRLVEMMQARFPSMNPSQLEKALKQVHVISVHTCSALMKCIHGIEKLIISKDVRLVVIDSVASLMRKEFSSASQSIIDRTNLLTGLASTLKYTAEFFALPVVTTNQITTQFRRQEVRVIQDEEEDFRSNEGLNSGGRGDLIAALGNTWSHSVNTRLILQYLPAGNRQVLVAKSPVSPFAAISFDILARGLVQQGDAVELYQGTDPGLQRILSKAEFPNASTWP